MCKSLFETAIRVVHVWCVRVSAPGASCYRVGTWIRLFAKARAHRKLRFFHSRRIFALFVEPASYSPSVQPWTNAIGRSVPSANENAMIHTEFDENRPCSIGENCEKHGIFRLPFHERTFGMGRGRSVATTLQKDRKKIRFGKLTKWGLGVEEGSGRACFAVCRVPKVLYSSRLRFQVRRATPCTRASCRSTS